MIIRAKVAGGALGACQAGDRKPRSRVREEKGPLKRLIDLAQSNAGEWVLGYEDEIWWSRFERPSLHSWAEAGESMRLLQKEAKKDDPDPKALSCSGLALLLIHPNFHPEIIADSLRQA
jgi:hypothetical protein